MSLWKLYPKARQLDPRWLDFSYRKPLLVEADSPAEARLKAAHWERRFIDEHYGNESPAGRSAFEDEKLYASVEISPEIAESEEDSGMPLIH